MQEYLNQSKQVTVIHVAEYEMLTDRQTPDNSRQLQFYTSQWVLVNSP